MIINWYRGEKCYQLSELLTQLTLYDPAERIRPALAGPIKIQTN